jgi:hypothetical protein
MIRSELPHYCFPDGQPKSKKKGKRVQQTVSCESPIGDGAYRQTASEVGAEDSMEGPGPSKKAK